MIDQLIERVLETWRVSNRITLLLLRAIPQKGLQVVPLNSQGRIVAEQFAHLHRVRFGWLQYSAGRKRGYLYGLPTWMWGKA